MAGADNEIDAFTGGDHDHGRCVADAVAAAAALCLRRGVRLTEIRRRVLELVWASHNPVGAYDILDRLGRERGRVAPPTVYRALEFLCAQRLVHRIDSMNAFVGCAFPGAPHRAYFLICGRCGNAAEIDDRSLRSALDALADRAGFLVEQETVELSGVCPQCRPSPTDPKPELRPAGHSPSPCGP